MKKKVSNEKNKYKAIFGVTPDYSDFGLTLECVQ